MNQSIDYYIFRVWSEESDPGVSHYPLMSNPLPTLAITVAYIYFAKVIGPSIMKSRKEVDVSQLMIAYNFIEVALSAWMAIESFLASNYSITSWSCVEANRLHSSTDPQDDFVSRRIKFVAWVFFMSKFVEFSDTVFMVLRKKNSQITKLHLIHHSIVPLSMWFELKFAPLALNLWTIGLNAFVHTLMYSYYCLTIIETAFKSETKVSLGLKPWITRIQITQFILGISQCIYLAMLTDASCVLPKTFFISCANVLLFLFLFVDFYYQAYIKKSEKKA